jgi:phospholipid/cholesterol/gamma-HCH transport system substrate-binding protein
MRTRKKDKRNSVKVGAFLTLLSAVLMLMVASIGNENSLFASKVIIRARVPNVSNLRPGSYVELKGIRIGAVTDVRIVSPEEVEVSAKVLERELKWVRKDSKVAISNAGLVGDKYLEVMPGSPDSPKFEPEKDYLVSEHQTGLSQIMAKGESIATVTERILQRADSILTNLEQGAKLTEGVSAMSKTAQNLEAITKELKEAHLGKMATSVNSSMARMDRILGQVEKGPGTAHSMIYDDSLHDDLRALLGGAQRNKVIKYFIRESIKNSEKRE